MGPDAVLGGCIFGRCFSGKRYDGHGSRSWRNDGEVTSKIDFKFHFFFKSLNFYLQLLFFTIDTKV